MWEDTTNEVTCTVRSVDPETSNSHSFEFDPFYEENTRYSSRKTSMLASPRRRASLLFAMIRKIGKIRWINWSEINVEGKSEIDEKRNAHIIETVLFVEATYFHNACHTTDMVATFVWSQAYLPLSKTYLKTRGLWVSFVSREHEPRIRNCEGWHSQSGRLERKAKGDFMGYSWWHRWPGYVTMSIWRWTTPHVMDRPRGHG